MKLKVDLDLRVLNRLGEQIPSVWELLSKYEPFAPLSTFLAGDEELPEENLDVDKAFAMARDRNGSFDIRTRVGSITLSWSYGPKAWFCGIYGEELRVADSELNSVRALARELSVLVGSAYTNVELHKTKSLDVHEFADRSGFDPPWDYLGDLYWYNYFGAELTKVLKDAHGLSFDVQGLQRLDLPHGWEVMFEGVPQLRPRPPAIEAYLAKAGIFRRYNRKARFRSGRVAFDYSRLRQNTQIG